MPGGRLPRRETELVILRVAHLRSCTYEWEHHVRLGSRAGIGPDEIVRLQGDRVDERWTPREAAILAAVEELHASGDLTDATWERIRNYLDDRRAIELVLLVGHYEMLATALTALRIAPDPHRQSSHR